MHTCRYRHVLLFAILLSVVYIYSIFSCCQSAWWLFNSWSYVWVCALGTEFQIFSFFFFKHKKWQDMYGNMSVFIFSRTCGHDWWGCFRQKNSETWNSKIFSGGLLLVAKLQHFKILERDLSGWCGSHYPFQSVQSLEFREIEPSLNSFRTQSPWKMLSNICFWGIFFHINENGLYYTSSHNPLELCF